MIGIFAPDEKRLLVGAGFHLREGPLSTACAEMGMFIRQSEAGRGLGTRVGLIAEVRKQDIDERVVGARAGKPRPQRRAARLDERAGAGREEAAGRVVDIGWLRASGFWLPP